MRIPAEGYDVNEPYGYDALGNLRLKAGKTYTYGTCAAGPHAVCAVDGGAPFVYDPNGNMTSGSDRTIDYNPANKPVHITGQREERGAAGTGRSWVMRGPSSLWNYIWSGKWDFMPWNEFASFNTAEMYLVPPQSLSWPGGPLGIVKGLLGQRIYGGP